MTFTYGDFAAEIQPPDNCHTAQSVWCFHNDPYVYYRTYVQNKLPVPPLIRSQVEMLYKYELLLGSSEFGSKFAIDAPVNPATNKPYGEDTQKFSEWAKTVKNTGKIAVHPNNASVAHTIYEQTMEQIIGGFIGELAYILAPGGQSGILHVSSVDNSNCYAHVDYLSEKCHVCKVATVSSLDWLKDSTFVDEMAFTLAFQWLVLKESPICLPLQTTGYAIVAEHNLPYRVTVIPVNIFGKWEAIAMESLQKLNQSFNAGPKAWLSKYHNANPALIAA